MGAKSYCYMYLLFDILLIHSPHFYHNFTTVLLQFYDLYSVLTPKGMWQQCSYELLLQYQKHSSPLSAPLSAGPDRNK